MSLRITILGCGSSGGVPRVGSGWGAADPTNSRNRRRRCSIIVQQVAVEGTTAVLVDTSPDLRDQLLSADIRHLDAVLITHDHADHTHGIDDLRPLVIHTKRRMPIYVDARTSKVLNERFGYCFAAPADSDYPPILKEHRITAGEPFNISGAGGTIKTLPFDMQHGRNYQALGFRFGDAAYASDVSAFPETSVARLRGLKLLILDALRYTPHPTHFSIEEALAFIERVKPDRAVLTNLHTDVDYETLCRQLPDGIVPAFDGMQLTIEGS